jgi:hypothetical protein
MAVSILRRPLERRDRSILEDKTEIWAENLRCLIDSDRNHIHLHSHMQLRCNVKPKITLAVRPSVKVP